MRLKIQDIIPNPKQPRKDFNEEELQELAESIKNTGLKERITVRKLANGNKYQIIDGERRYRACKLLGLEEIPVEIREDVQTEEEATFQSLIINVQWSNYTPQDFEAAIYEQSQKMPTRKLAAGLGYKHHSQVDNIIRAYKQRQKLLPLSPTIVGSVSTAALNLTSSIKDERIRIGILKMISDGRIKTEYNAIRDAAKILAQTPSREAQEACLADLITLEHINWMNEFEKDKEFAQDFRNIVSFFREHREITWPEAKDIPLALKRGVIPGLLGEMIDNIIKDIYVHNEIERRIKERSKEFFKEKHLNKSDEELREMLWKQAAAEKKIDDEERYDNIVVPLKEKYGDKAMNDLSSYLRVLNSQDALPKTEYIEDLDLRISVLDFAYDITLWMVYGGLTHDFLIRADGGGTSDRLARFEELEAEVKKSKK